MRLPPLDGPIIASAVYESKNKNKGKLETKGENASPRVDVTIIWVQWVFDDTGEEIVEADAMARRIWWIDDYISPNPELIYTLPGTQ